MKIVYNPPTGAPIKGFNFEGNIVEDHPVNETGHYEDAMADALVATYPFMTIISQEAEDNLKAAEEEVVPSENSEEPPLYVAKKDRKSVKVSSSKVKVKKVESKVVDQGTEIPDDLKGTDWYGDGPKESRND